jgi:hypothetical protein
MVVFAAPLVHTLIPPGQVKIVNSVYPRLGQDVQHVPAVGRVALMLLNVDIPVHLGVHTGMTAVVRHND